MMELHIVVAALLLGMGYFGSPLDGKEVLQWSPSTCSDGYSWRGEVTLGGGWVTFAHAQRGSCTVYEKGINLQWRACCVGDEVLCVGHEIVTQMPIPCESMHWLDGRPVEQGVVDRWNAEHVGGGE